MIEELELVEGNKKALNNLKLDVEINNEEKIIAKISEVTDTSGNKMNLLQQVLAKLRKADDDGVLTISPEAQDPDISIQYKIGENEDWQDYTESVEIHENTKIRAQATRGGKISDISIKVVDNIDTKEPELNDFKEENEAKAREESITAVLTDNASGIVKYGISRNQVDEPEYIMADKDLTEEDISKNINRDPKLTIDAKIDGISQNGIYYVWIWDSAGNCAKKQVNITQVEEVDVAQIVNSEGHQDLNGNKYKSLYDAIAASPEGAKTTIKLLDEIYNENNVINNKDITLNLDGHNLNNKGISNPTLTVNGGASLTIINEDAEGKVKTSGSITSQNTCAINVKSSATFIMRSSR